MLQVQIENSTPDFARAVNGIPSVATQSVNTNILMGDGETLVLGGILIDQDSNNIRQVPGFGSIPLIGHLFKETETLKSTAELLFFITPRITRPDFATVAPTGPRLPTTVIQPVPMGNPPSNSTPVVEVPVSPVIFPSSGLAKPEVVIPAVPVAK